MLALRLARGARPAVQLRRLLVAAASAGTGFLLLCTLGYAMGHPEAYESAALRLAWCVAPLAATVQFAVAVARTDPATRPRSGLSAIGLGPGHLMVLAAISTAVACTLGSMVALLLFLHLRGDLSGLPFDGAAAGLLAADEPLPLPAALTLLTLVPVIASVSSALILRPREGQQGGAPARARQGRFGAFGTFGAYSRPGERAGFGEYGRFGARAGARADGHGDGDGPGGSGRSGVPGGHADGAGSSGRDGARGAAVSARDTHAVLGAQPGHGGAEPPDSAAAYGEFDGSGSRGGAGAGADGRRGGHHLAGSRAAAASPSYDGFGAPDHPDSSGHLDGPTRLDGPPQFDGPARPGGPAQPLDPYQPPAPLASPSGLPWGVAVLAAGLAVETYAGRTGSAPDGPALPGGFTGGPVGVLVGWALTAVGLALAGPGLAHLCGRLLQAVRPGAVRLLAGRVLMAEAGRLGRPLGVVCAVASGAYAMAMLYTGARPGIGPLTTLGALLVAGCAVATLLTAAVEARNARADTTAALLRLGAPATMLRTTAALRAGALLAVFGPLTWAVAELAALPLTG
ncbi:hypothetical protein [Streptomyces sp. NPDC050704]|uniref:hypothetical protein n=1 Tax=Streptomyces sp. NPDC050704 TaxID=3157219 RepID=UPI003416BBC5